MNAKIATNARVVTVILESFQQNHEYDPKNLLKLVPIMMLENFKEFYYSHEPSYSQLTEIIKVRTVAELTKPATAITLTELPEPPKEGYYDPPEDSLSMTGNDNQAADGQI